MRGCAQGRRGPIIAGVVLVALCTALGAAAPRALAAQARGADVALQLRIGSADGDEPYLFARITGALRLSTGHIVVADGSTQELRWFSPTGEWLHTRGGAGSGPGEFRGLRSLLLLPGDSVLAEDGLESRMTLYDAGGRLVRTWQISAAGSFVTPPPVGRLPDGSFVAVAEREIDQPPGLIRFSATLIRYRDGRLLDTLGTLAGGERFTVPCGTPQQRALCGMSMPYGLRAHAGVAGGRAFAGNGARYELLRMDPATGRVDTLRRDVPVTPLTPARRAYFIDSLVRPLPPERGAVVRERYAGAPVHREMPYFEALIVEDDARLWLARPQAQGAVTRQWDVLDTQGRLLRSVLLPAALRVTQVAHGRVVGVSRDEDGVEYVEVHR